MAQNFDYTKFVVITVFFRLTIDESGVRVNGSHKFIVDKEQWAINHDRDVVNRDNVAKSLALHYYATGYDFDTNFTITNVMSEYDQIWLENIADYLKETEITGFYSE